MRLQTKLILIICSFLSIVIICLGSIFYYIMTTALEDQIGTRALRVAETVAAIPDIRLAFQTSDPSKIIQPIAESIRDKIDAEYIVVGNREGIRFSHPLPERIGKEMVGGDNGPVLAGQSIISKAIGSLGPSLRGKAPIFDDQGKVIGIVSVGFLTKDINSITYAYQSRIELISLIVLVVGLIGSVLIARNVRSSIHGLSPRKSVNCIPKNKQFCKPSARELSP